MSVCKEITNTESSWQIIQIRKKLGGVGGKCVWSGRVGGGGLVVSEFFFDKVSIFFAGGGGRILGGGVSGRA